MSRSGFSLTLLLPLLAALPAFAQKPVVTATQWVSVGNNKQELLRQINSRWWTQDNREVYPPKQNGLGFFWVVDSKPGVTEFYHHRPFDIGKSEWVHLWMKPDEVEALLGPPNRRFPMSSGRGGMCYYYAADGTALRLWFMDRDELGEARYLYRGGGEKSVASIERELNGESIFHLSAQRAGKSFSRGAQPRLGSMPSVEVARAPGSDRPAVKQVVTKEALASVQLGAERQDVLARLGEPSSRAAITGGEELKETFTYHLEDGTPVALRLLNGKVVKVP
jgi:hypothetical protein